MNTTLFSLFVLRGLMDVREKNGHSLRCNIDCIETMCDAQLTLLLYIHRNFIHYVKEVAQFSCVTRFPIVILHSYVCFFFLMIIQQSAHQFFCINLL